jgi:hypothetical protein
MRIYTRQRGPDGGGAGEALKSWITQGSVVYGFRYRSTHPRLALVAEGLRKAGYDGTHVGDYVMQDGGR